MDQTLKDLSAAYTAVQVPHVLGSVCRSGTYFHTFESADVCLAKTEELVKEFEGGGDYTAWCQSLGKATEAAPAASEAKEEKAATTTTETTTCGCVGMPASLMGNATARKGYPATYGESCAAHDLTTEACSGTYKAAYCYEEWCYVDPSCDVSDKKETFFFQGEEMFYSYQHCGGLDAYAAEACGKQKDADSCHSFSSNCAFNEHAGACQNKLCQCTGDNLGINTTKYGFTETYGESCKAWDQGSCRAGSPRTPAVSSWDSGAARTGATLNPRAHLRRNPLSRKASPIRILLAPMTPRSCCSANGPSRSISVGSRCSSAATLQRR
jgi:hypothetical protein